MESRRREERRPPAPALAVRKGPWMAEEDEILMEYVRNYGPQNWSSVRSRGYLPRSGKSCRLRWVNKLKPNLKTGCKFSAEEERTVIDLQAQLGNKWAKIATYLPGRTDNDVKNFWSTRQKRLARILRTPSIPKSEDIHGKSPIVHEELSTFEGCGEEYCLGLQCSSIPLDLPILNFEAAQGKRPCLSNTTTTPPSPFSFLQLPQTLLDLPILPEGHHLAAGFGDMNFQTDPFARHEASGRRGGGGFPEGPAPCLDQLECCCDDHDVKMGEGEEEEEEGIPATPDEFFDDFPIEMFDYLEPPPSSSD